MSEGRVEKQRTRAKTAPRTRGLSPEKTARTRAILVQAAMTEFFANGFARTTMSKVAARAGLAKGTTYLYFPTKEALFAGVVRDVIINPLEEAERQEILSEESVGAYLRRTLLPVMRRIEVSGRASVARLVLAEGAQFPFLVDVYHKEVYGPLLRHAQRCGRMAFERGEISSEALVRFPQILVGPLWVGMIHNGILDRENPVDIGDMFETYIDLVFSGKGPQTAL